MLTTDDLKNDSVFNKPRINVLPSELALDLDIELSNHCNAKCYYCPRDLVGETGFMSDDVFKTIIDQVHTFPYKVNLLACGHGESILHPRVGELVAYARSKGLPFGLQTNGSLLTPKRRKTLLKAGLTTLGLSVSAIGELHEQMYQLEFAPILKNIKAFIKESRGSCSVKIYIVQTDLNKMFIKDYKTFWEDVGVDQCMVFPVHNRSGSISSKNIIYTDNPGKSRADQIFRDEAFSNLCAVALMTNFIGYDGNHYLCPNDWEKQINIGHVTTMSMLDAIARKATMLRNCAASICETCDFNIHNRIKDCLSHTDNTQVIDQLIANRRLEEKFFSQVFSAQESAR